jgi:PH (Pleckstrin Homology) domain-containing protein/putative oligomerization/nucleic acid binding protein/uncharacterized protein DUF2510
MSTPASWLSDPAGAHELRYWDGASWTEHVSDQGTQGTDPVPAGAALAPPEPPAASPPPPPPAAAAAEGVGESGGKKSWKDRLKSAAESATAKGKELADQAKSSLGEQQAKRVEQWKDDPETLWFGQSQSAATKATGVSKAFYRITKDRIWIESGVLGVRSEHVPLWAVKDIDVRQNVMQRGKDVGDVVLWLEDPSLAAGQGGTFSFGGQADVGGQTSGEVLLDNIEGPYQVRELLMPLVSDARQKKLVERQSQYIHQVNPVAAAPAAAPAAPVDVADQLKKLADLRDQGILSDEEFAAQKAKLLGT